jgi:hypothetical protein
MGSLVSIFRMHWDHEPRRSGVSAECQGGFYRRLKGRRGGLVANLALARKLAELFWRLMVHGVRYVEQGLKKYEEKVAQTDPAPAAKTRP